MTTSMIPRHLDPQTIRGQFPTLSCAATGEDSSGRPGGGVIYFDNAGGSQVPRVVADAMHDYMLQSYVQLGADYPMSRKCTQVVEEAHTFINLFMNGTDTGKVILGSSCTQHLFMLSECYAQVMREGDEIIVSRMGHDANICPWKRLEQRGFTIRTWEIDAETYSCPLEQLEGLLSDRTRIVALPHVSNMLGGIVDVKAVAKFAHRVGARVVVDGVAYASHRAINVSDWDIDWYIYSTYKVYGPHMSAMYGKQSALEEITGPNLDFIPKSEIPYKFELGGVNHEGCAGLLALGKYLNFLTGRDADASCDRKTIEEAYDIITALELPLQQRIIEYLLAKPGVTVVGPNHGKSSRVATICFRSDSVLSAKINAAICGSNIGARHGHMYAPDLCEKLGIDLMDGVARVSLLHYNTMEEVERLIEVLEEIL